MSQIILLSLLIGYSLIKYGLSYFVAALFICCFSPLFLLLLLLHLFGVPVLFFQTRIGLNNKPFTIIKIRTIFSEKHSTLNKLGVYLRKTSLDELPQFINMLKGEMCFIGPRPLLTEYLPLYSSSQLQRHRVKPGITGLAQVKGLNDISWTHKFRYDVFYAQKMSFRLDCYILWQTFCIFIGFKRFQKDRQHFQTPFTSN